MQIPLAYKEYINTTARYCLLIGGAGAGKSEAAARKTIIRALAGGRHLVVRKYATTLKQSVTQTILNLLNQENIPHEYNKSERLITLASGGEILFAGLDDPEKLKSIHSIVSVWVEEASEITVHDFRQIDLRLRGQIINQDKARFYKQITLTANPVANFRWIEEELAKKVAGTVYVLRTTYKDNPFIDSEYVNVLTSISDSEYKNVYLEGQWGGKNTALVFPAWQRWEGGGEFSFFGLDFGFTNPTALVGVLVDGDKYFVEEILYRSNVTNSELVQLVKSVAGKGQTVYCDSAEPARIEELKRAGVNAVAANKDTRGGLAFLRELASARRLYIAGKNLEKELNAYSFKTNAAGEVTDEIVKLNDHLIDAMRYAIYTHYTNSTKRLSEKDLIIARRLSLV